MSQRRPFPAARVQGELAKPGPSQGSVGLLTLLLIASLALAGGLFVASRLTAMDREAGLEQAALAQRAAAQLDSVLAHAWGAGAAAGEVSRFGPADPAALVQAASRARGVSAAALMRADGSVIAVSGDQAGAAGRAALAAAGEANSWVGPVVTQAGAAPRIAMARRVHAGVMVIVADQDLYAWQASEGGRLLLVAPDGTVMNGERARGSIAGAIGLAETPSDLVGAAQVLPATDGGRLALGAARTQVGEFTVVSVRPVDRALRQMLPALSQFLLLLLGPALSVAALLLMLRQNAKRAVAAEVEVERAEAKARLTADGARAGFFEWSLAEGELHLSEYAMTMLGALKENVTLSEFLSRAAPEDRAAAEEAFRQARRTGALDARFRVGFGPETAWIEAHGLGLETSPGAGAEKIIGTLVDVTQRWEAEERASALEQRLREAISSYSGPFALWNRNRRIVLWNKSFQSVLGLGPDILRPSASYETVMMAAAAHIVRERIDPNDPMSREMLVSEGQWYRMVERRTAEGGLVTVGIDVTDMKRQEEAMTDNERHLLETVARLEKSEQRNKILARQAEEERRKAEDASAAKSAFLANMSHELRTPLNAIIGFSEIMMKELFGPLGSDQYKSYSQDIHNSGNLLLELITDVLDMAKIEAGRYQLTPKSLDPQVAIDQALRLMRRKADEKGLQLLSECDELPEIEADHRAVKQMLLNLLSNAVKFTDQGAVMVHARASDWGIEIRVVDTGRGIPPEALPRLARPFEQVETELIRNTSGTGLGLALTKSLVEMHGGRLEIESQLGRGTMVAIHLPKAFGGHIASGEEEAMTQAAE